MPHSPSPWFKGNLNIYAADEVKTRPNGEAIPVNPKVIAEMVKGWGMTSEELADNMNLLVAAPELLEATTDALTGYYTWYFAHIQQEIADGNCTQEEANNYPTMKTYRKLKAALARAKGENV